MTRQGEVQIGLEVEMGDDGRSLSKNDLTQTQVEEARDRAQNDRDCCP